MTRPAVQASCLQSMRPGWSLAWPRMGPKPTSHELGPTLTLHHVSLTTNPEEPKIPCTRQRVWVAFANPP